MNGYYQDFYHDAGHDPGVMGHDPGVFVQHGHHAGGVNAGDFAGHGHHHGHEQSFDAKSYAGAFGGQTHHHHGGFLSQLLGADGHHHHGILARLLGLDTKHHYAHTRPAEVTRQGQFLWENLGRVFKSDIFDEFDLTPGVLFFSLLGGMVAWLFVLSFTRHHEPQVNALLGANVAQVSAYENQARLEQGVQQKPVELSQNHPVTFSFYTPKNMFSVSRIIAKEGEGFTTMPLPGQGMPITSTPTPAAAGAQAMSSIRAARPNGTSEVRTPDGRIQTIVAR